MLSGLLRSFFIGALALASQARRVPDKVLDPFDGQYTHPTAANGGVEWKFFQLVADPVGDNPPASLSVLFYQGYALQFGPRDPTLPEYYVSVTGSFPNGTTFALTLPAASARITARAQTVTGTWGSVAHFTGSPDLATYTARFTAPHLGLEGAFNITARGAPHLGCNTTTHTTFASAVPRHAKLSPAEHYVYNELGWMTSIPGGSSSAELTVQGTRLKFSGQGYHDGNYAPAPVNSAVETWYAAAGQVGPYDLTYIFVVPLNSSKILTAGHLARDGVVLQNQCSISGAKTNDAVSVAPYGIVHDAVSGDDVPAGFIVQYTLANREVFRFNLTSVRNVQVPDEVPYHRFIGRGAGGRVGGETYAGPFLSEWLNPAMKAYVPPA